MHSMKRFLVVVSAAIAVAAAGLVTSRWGVPAARAEAPQRWEQRCFFHRGGMGFSDEDEQEVNQKLAAAGKDGWELVSAAGAAMRQDFLVCMKRPAR